MFAYCDNNPVIFVDPHGDEPIAITISVVAASALVVIAAAIVSYCVVSVVWEVGAWFADAVLLPYAQISYEKDTAEPEPPDVTYPGDDPTKAPDGYEWRGPDAPGGKRGGYANPNGKDSWHPDLDHPDGIAPRWDYNDGLGHKWRVFPDHLEVAIK